MFMWHVYLSTIQVIHIMHDYIQIQPFNRYRCKDMDARRAANDG